MESFGDTAFDRHFDAWDLYCPTVLHPYKAKVLVPVNASPRNEAFASTMEQSRGFVETVLSGSGGFMAKETVVLPERWLSPLEQISFMAALDAHPGIGTLKELHLVTMCPVILTDFLNESIKTLTFDQPEPVPSAGRRRHLGSRNSSTPDWETGQKMALGIMLRESNLDAPKTTMLLGHLLRQMPCSATGQEALDRFYAGPLRGHSSKLERHFLWDDVVAIEEWAKQTFNTFFANQPPTDAERDALSALFAKGRALREGNDSTEKTSVKKSARP